MPNYCLTFLLAAAVALLGCRRSHTIETPDGEKVTVDERSETVVIQGADGKQITVGGAAKELPPGFPAEDVPPYEGAEILATVDSPQAKSVTFRTPDSPDKVKEFYTARLQQQGWSVQTTLNAGGRILVHFEKGKRALALIVGSEEGTDGTTVNLGVMER